MLRPIALLGVLAALSSAACAGSSTEDTAADGAAEALSTGAAHSKAVKACNATHDKAARSAASTFDMVSAETDWHTCLESANASAIKTVESILTKNGSGYAGQTQAAFDDARRADEVICTELDKASPNFGGTLSRVEAASCRAERESFLAALVDDMVAFPGTKPTYLAEDRTFHAACYATYDASAKTAETTVDMVSMNEALKQCIHLEIQDFDTPLANIQIENDASSGPFITAQSRIGTDIAGKVSSAGPICRVLSEAGENGIGTLSRVSAAACTARVTENLYTYVKAAALPDPF